MDGVGEALVFLLKTSHQLKTRGLVYGPVPGRWQSQGQSQRQGQSQHKASPRYGDAKCKHRQVKASPR